VGAKSLNINVRRKENERIERENHAMAKRLFDKSSALSKKLFDNEYHSHLKYRHQIQRRNKKQYDKFNLESPNTKAEAITCHPSQMTPERLQSACPVPKQFSLIIIQQKLEICQCR
jgi:hypothetical protein